MNIPAQLVQGDSRKWQDAPFVGDLGARIDSGSYTLKYSLRGPVTLDLSAATYEDGWQTTLSTTDSATLTAGNYAWTAYAVSATERITAGQGVLEVIADLTAQAAGYDSRTQAEKNLDAVETEIAARIAGHATVDYTIGTRSLKKEPISALLALRSQLKYEIRRDRRKQKIANGQGDPTVSYIRFR